MPEKQPEGKGLSVIKLLFKIEGIKVNIQR